MSQEPKNTSAVRTVDIQQLRKLHRTSPTTKERNEQKTILEEFPPEEEEMISEPQKWNSFCVLV